MIYLYGPYNINMALFSCHFKGSIAIIIWYERISCNNMHLAKNYCNSCEGNEAFHIQLMMYLHV